MRILRELGLGLCVACAGYWCSRMLTRSLLSGVYASTEGTFTGPRGNVAWIIRKQGADYLSNGSDGLILAEQGQKDMTREVSQMVPHIPWGNFRIDEVAWIADREMRVKVRKVAVSAMVVDATVVYEDGQRISIVSK